MIGRIHSIETMATLDGPGLRTVIFMQGCPLRCKFCHNVDLAPKDGGQEIEVADLVKKVLKNKEYWGEGLDKDGKVTGGVTFSGGEPTFQSPFLLELLKEFKQEGIHTAVDSCSFTGKKILDRLLPYVDLWMLSVKHMVDEEHRKLTGVPNEVIQNNIKYVDDQITKQKLATKIRIRYVVIPGITDSKENIQQLAEFVTGIKNLETLELLPYTSMGKHKWLENFGEYPLEDIEDASYEQMQPIIKTLEQYGISLIY